MREALAATTLIFVMVLIGCPVIEKFREAHARGMIRRRSRDSSRDPGCRRSRLRGMRREDIRPEGEPCAARNMAGIKS